MIKIITNVIGFYLNIMAVIAPKHAANIGFRVFCTPINTKLKPSQASFYDTATKETFKAEGLPDIQVYKWGNGTKTVLMAHGWQSHAFRWIKYILALQKLDYTVYAIDAPAHGSSEGKLLNLPLYAKVLAALTKEKGGFDYMVGHSLGAFAIEYMHSNQPDLSTKKLLLLACPGNAQEFVDLYAEALGLTEKAKECITGYFVSKFGKRPSYFSSVDFGKKLKVGGLLIHDEGDKDAPFVHAKELHEVWKGSESYFTKGLGHKLKSPDVVNKVVEYLEAQ